MPKSSYFLSSTLLNIPPSTRVSTRNELENKHNLIQVRSIRSRYSETAERHESSAQAERDDQDSPCNGKQGMGEDVHHGERPEMAEKAAHKPESHFRREPNHVQKRTGIVDGPVSPEEQANVARHTAGNARPPERLCNRAAGRGPTRPRGDNCQRQNQQQRHEAVDQPVIRGSQFRSRNRCYPASDRNRPPLFRIHAMHRPAISRLRWPSKSG